MGNLDQQLRPQQAALPLSRAGRWIAAMTIILGAGTTLVNVIANPGYYHVGNGEITAFIADFAVSSPLMGQIHVVSGVFAAYLLPLGLLAMAWLAHGRAPRWANIAMLVILVGLLPLPAFAAEDSLSYDIGRLGSNSAVLNMALQFDHDAVMSYYKIMFIVGSILGPTLLGIALWRSQAVPTWAAALITMSRPMSFLFPLLPTQLGIIVQLPSWLLLFAGSLPAAGRFLRAR